MRPDRDHVRTAMSRLTTCTESQSYLLFHICEATDWSAGFYGPFECRRSAAFLAARAGRSVRWVQMLVAGLERKGILRRVLIPPRALRSAFGPAFGPQYAYGGMVLVWAIPNARQLEGMRIALRELWSPVDQLKPETVH